MPLAFRTYSAALILVALVSVLALAATADHSAGSAGAIPIFAALILVGELLPLRVPRGEGFEEVTVSAPFALAAMALFGPLVALAMYGGWCLAIDLAKRKHPVKAAFNLSQSAVALAAASGTYALLGGDHGAVDAGAALLPLIVAALVFFAVDNLLADVGGALLAGRPTWRYAREDLAFHLWTGGILLLLAPVAVACADASLWLVPILFAPVAAIYLGARQAVMNTHRSLHDPLTDLPNRGFLVRRLDGWIGGAGGVTLAVVGFDDLPVLLQTLGRERGDDLVCAIARRLAALVSADCFVAALGQDEFAVACRSQDDPALAAAVRSALADPVEIAGLALRATPRCGVAGSAARRRRRRGAGPGRRGRPEHRARGARRRGGVCGGQGRPAARPRGAGGAASPCPRPRRDRRALPAEGRPARPGRSRGVEALVRWHHPQRGQLAPDAFVPLAERLGLIDAAHAQGAASRRCGSARALARRRGWTCTVAVNLSARSLLDRGAARASIARAARRFGVPPRVAPARDHRERADGRPERALGDARAAARDWACSMAIDDFGTGYSSLAYLKQLPVERAEDRPLVRPRPCASTRSDATIVRSTIELARNLGLTVIAEGVEDEAMLAPAAPRSAATSPRATTWAARPAATTAAARSPVLRAGPTPRPDRTGYRVAHRA